MDGRLVTITLLQRNLTWGWIGFRRRRLFEKMIEDDNNRWRMDGWKFWGRTSSDGCDGAGTKSPESRI